MQKLFDLFVRERTYLKSVTPKTLAWYRDSWRAFSSQLADCEHSAPAIKLALLDGIAALKERNVSAISINTYLRCINAFLRWAHTERHLGELVQIAKLKAEQKVLATLTAAHIQKLLAHRPSSLGGQRLHCLTALLLDTGLRIEEALSLTRDDVDLDNLLLKVKGKGGKHRAVPISFEMRKLLFRWMQRNEHAIVFPTRDGHHQLQRNVLRACYLVGAVSCEWAL